MRDLLLEYMSHLPNEKKIDSVHQGPVITISREYGCYGSGLATEIADRINKDFAPAKQWKTVDRHILSQVSNALHTDPSDISHIFGAEQRGFLADIIDSFSPKKYTSDHRVIATIKKVVRHFAEEGNTIIVGRAGCVIGAHIPRSLHIRLIATFDDRLRSVMSHTGLDEKEARKQIELISKKRQDFLTFFHGDKPDSELFDVVYNMSRLDNKTIVDNVIELAKYKKIIH